MEKSVYDNLNCLMPGIKNLDPDKAERKRLFLEDSTKQAQKQEMIVQLECFLDVVDSALGIADAQDDAEAKVKLLIGECERRLELADSLLKDNTEYLFNTILPLERAYRNMNLFFENTGVAKVPNVTIINSNPKECTVAEKTELFDLVRGELQHNYDRLDLRDNYSLVVIGSYLGSNVNLERWMKVAHENKAMLCTDFADLKDPLDVVEVFESQNHNGGELYKSNCIMCSNWIVARDGNTELAIPELHLSPAMALAGNLYSAVVSQPSAGKKHGTISSAKDVVFKLKKSEVSFMENLGLVPLVKEFGKVMAFSARTLFNGSNPGLQVYSVVRVFDYITKVLIDFLNRRAFENWNSAAEVELRQQIVKFLDEIEGPDRLIEKFKIVRFEKLSGDRDKIFLDINITPFFPAKSFLIKLDGMRDEDETKWKSDYKS